MSNRNIFFLGGIVLVVGAWLLLRERVNTSRLTEGNKPDASAPSSGVIAQDNTMPLMDASGELSFLSLPQGFSVDVFARDVPSVRVLAFDPAGNMLVSLLSSGRVVLVRDSNGDGMADDRAIVLSGLNQPHGLAFDCDESHCWLFVAETHRVMRYDYDATAARATNGTKLFDLPFGQGHATRTLLIAPVNGMKKLFVHVGSSCNVCVERDVRRATVLSANLDGSDVKVFASGLRNSVFLATHPVTGEVWATENGRDRLGDDIPPDEINILQEGSSYGWPYCYGKNIHDDVFDSGRGHTCLEPQNQPSYIDIQAHSAPLGLAFASGDGWPAEYRNTLFVAYHGSWNRSIPTGYKVVWFHLDERGQVLGQEDFITGWRQPDGAVRGRPVAILTRSDGTMYISDDRAGVIYRVSVVK